MLNRALDELDDDRLVDLYPWPEGRWFRANMVMTLDGATVGPDGLSKSLSSGADQRVFRALRSTAEVVLVGAGTMRAERYSPMGSADEARRRRQDLGLAPGPRLAVLSSSLDLPWDEPVWEQSALRPLVLTGRDAPAERRAEAEQHAELVVLEAAKPDVHGVVAALEERGLRRILCEGGAGLLGELAEARLLDEADVTLAPLFAGTQESPRTPAIESLRRLRPVHALHQDDYLMLRYVGTAS